VLDTRMPEQTWAAPLEPVGSRVVRHGSHSI